MSNLKEIAPATYILEQEGKMRVPGLIIASETLLQQEDMQQPLQQVRNVAELPGIVGYSIAMPDIHWGYGFPIGGVAAMDAEEGIISPGGVGYDINCGVRLAMAPLKFEDLTASQKDTLLHTIYQQVPSGVGHGHKGSGLSESDYQALLEKGAAWSIEKGYGFSKDIEHTESYGCIIGADPEAVTRVAKERGRKQLGSIGSGNHFVEIGEVQNIFSPAIAKDWGIEEKQLYILIHSGSRGFGHQVCQDTLDEFLSLGYGKHLPDSQLVAAPIKSNAGKKYFSAMAAAANFAFNNRQHILHSVRRSFSIALGIHPEEIKLIYDVCHNIAKFEEYKIEGKKRRLCVHRKGATRAFGPGAEELVPLFRKTGQPVLVPGDMGRASYLLVGLGNERCWCSCCHGAGRARSRVQSMKRWRHEDPIEYMRKQGVSVMASSFRTIAEEMPDAYKDVNLVIEAAVEARLADTVARLRPRLVIKG
jgi:tRNA-splicing ligase RtcB